MRINLFAVKQTRQQNNNSIQNFNGLRSSIGKSGFFFDYDGTLARKMTPQIRSDILELKKRAQADIVIVSGNSLDEYLGKLRKTMPDQATPEAKYLVANDGSYIYQNVEGTWVKDTEYEDFIRLKSHYNSEKVAEALNGMAKSGQFRLPEVKLAQLRALENFEEIRASDPDFYDSAFTPYLWNPTEFSNKMFVASGTNIRKLQNFIQQELAKQGIKVQFIRQDYSKPIMDKCSKSILLKSNETRRKPDGGMTALFLYPMLKADGIKYLAEKLGIKYGDMVIAGNAENDRTLVHLAQKGANFICIGNAEDAIKTLCRNLQRRHSQTIHFSDREGAEGILDGMREIITV